MRANYSRASFTLICFGSLPGRQPLAISLLLVLLSTSWQGELKAAELRIAVAANFSGTLKQLVALYHQQPGAQGDRIRLISGSTGALYAQIRNGAPYDLFLAADQRRPQALHQAGLASSEGPFTYAEGQVVLWSPDDALLVSDAQAVKTGLPGVLQSKQRLGYLSVANPDTAPYGYAARQVLESFGVWRSLNQKEQIIRAGNIGQVYSQVASGAASFGFIALSQSRHPNVQRQGSLWLPPSHLYDPIIQQGVILARGQSIEACRRFVRWMRTDQAALQLIVAEGYHITTTPEAP